MKRLNWELKKLCKENPEDSHAYRAERERVLAQAATELLGFGFRQLRAVHFKPRHAEALVGSWKKSGLDNRTIANRLSHLRWWAEKVGKTGMLPPNRYYGILTEAEIERNRAWRLDEATLGRVDDTRARLSLRLQQEFGLRRAESILFRVSEADRGDRVALRGSWCKSGRAREIPVRTEAQRALLKEIRETVGASSLIPDEKRYIEQEIRVNHECEKAGIRNMHGLRHGYAQKRYRELTGRACSMAGGRPRAQMNRAERGDDTVARRIIAKELGHGRIQVSYTYLGE